MKQLLITIAALVLVGCGPSKDIYDAAVKGDIKGVKFFLDDGTNVNVHKGGLLHCFLRLGEVTRKSLNC